MDFDAIADALVEHIRAAYSDDVALVATYGSVVRGDADSASDLDVFFVPATPRGRGANLQFVLDGIGFDLWPMDWQRAESIAEYNEPIVSVLAYAHVVHALTQEDLHRLQSLQARIAELQSPASRPQMLGKAANALDTATARLPAVDRACTTSLSAVKLEAYAIVTGTLWSLALLNQTFFRKGWGRNWREVLDLQIRPAGLEERVAAIIEGKDPGRVAAQCRELLAEVRDLLNRELGGLAPIPIASLWRGYYEEARSSFNRIRHACRELDRDTAWFGAARLQAELRSMLDRTDHGSSDSADLPDLLAAFDDGGLVALAVATEELETKLVAFLQAAGVATLAFDDVEQLSAHLRSSAAASRLKVG